jgi:hypothetical protein
MLDAIDLRSSFRMFTAIVSRSRAGLLRLRGDTTAAVTLSAVSRFRRLTLGVEECGRALPDAHLSDDGTVAKMGHPVLFSTLGRRPHLRLNPP